MHRKKKFLDLKLVQISSSVLNKASVHRKGSICNWKRVRNNHRNCSTLSEDQKGALEVKTIEGLTQAITNADELEEALMRI